MCGARRAECLYPIPATAEALSLLTAWGDDGVRDRTSWLCQSVEESSPHADAVAIRFVEDDLTLAFIRPPTYPATSSFEAPVAPRSSLALTFADVATSPTRIIAVLTIYSTREGAFTDIADVLEDALGSVRGASVLDADLVFDVLGRAVAAPAQLRAQQIQDIAIGVLMAAQNISEDEAEIWLDDAARMSTGGRTDAATKIITLHQKSSGLDERG